MIRPDPARTFANAVSAVILAPPLRRARRLGPPAGYFKKSKVEEVAPVSPSENGEPRRSSRASHTSHINTATMAARALVTP